MFVEFLADELHPSALGKACFNVSDLGPDVRRQLVDDCLALRLHMSAQDGVLYYDRLLQIDCKCIALAVLQHFEIALYLPDQYCKIIATNAACKNSNGVEIVSMQRLMP